MSITTLQRDNQLIIRWEGKIKTQEDFADFSTQFRATIAQHIDTLKSQKWKLFLINAFPFNTYALGYLLKLKQRDGFDFSISTDHYKIYSIFEQVEFNELFDIAIEQDPLEVR